MFDGIVCFGTQSIKKINFFFFWMKTKFAYVYLLTYLHMILTQKGFTEQFFYEFCLLVHTVQTDILFINNFLGKCTVRTIIHERTKPLLMHCVFHFSKLLFSFFQENPATKHQKLYMMRKAQYIIHFVHQNKNISTQTKL